LSVTNFDTAIDMLGACRPIILAEFSSYYARALGYSWSTLAAFYERVGYQAFTLFGVPLTAEAPFDSRANFNYLAIPRGRQR
jgi:hypothetical protein